MIQLGKENEKLEIKTVFTIMPFINTHSRNQKQLTSFFKNNIRQPIETHKFNSKYRVTRSNDTFNITEQIIKDLYFADIVIADLSGEYPNPNVMYELGVRLAFSNNPIILIREKHPKNKDVFDVSGFYTKSYDPMDYKSLSGYLINKITQFESSNISFRSPILMVLENEVPMLKHISKQRAAELMEVFSACLSGTIWILTNALCSYLKTKDKIFNQFSDFNTVHLVSFLQKEKKVLQQVDWTEFDFCVGSQPAIDYYLASPYLTGLLPQDTIEKFNKVLIYYYAFFLSSNWAMRQGKISPIHKFAGETQILVTMGRIIRQYLLETQNEKKKELLKMFNKEFRRSKQTLSE